MSSDAVNQLMARFAPLLFAIGIVMVVCGAILTLYFGYNIYQLIATPDQSAFLNYLLSQMPGPLDRVTTLSGTMDGKEFIVNIPTDIFAYGRYGLAFLIFAMVGGLVSNLVSGGMNIFMTLMRINKDKTIILNQKEMNNADTRNSNYTR